MKLVINRKTGKWKRVEETPQDLARMTQDAIDHHANIGKKAAKKVRKEDLMKKLKLDDDDVRILLEIINDKEI